MLLQEIEIWVSPAHIILYTGPLRLDIVRYETGGEYASLGHQTIRYVDFNPLLVERCCLVIDSLGLKILLLWASLLKPWNFVHDLCCNCTRVWFLCFLCYFHFLLLLLLKLFYLHLMIFMSVNICVVILIMLSIFYWSLVTTYWMRIYRDISVACLKFLDDISQLIYWPYINISAIFY